MANICFFINHFWLCAAMVSRRQPVSKWLRPQCYKALKQIKKQHVFWLIWENSRRSNQTFTQHLKFTIRHKCINILSTLLLKTVVLHTFLVDLQILLKKYGTNQCLFKHWLKHKCTWANKNMCHETRL